MRRNKDLQTKLVNLADSETDITIIIHINVFLNEQCRDSINFAYFLDQIKVKHNDLEKNAQLGFVNAISKIIMDKLKQWTLHERPKTYILCDICGIPVEI